MTVRPIRPDDVPAVVGLVRELAEYEEAPDEARMTEEQLHSALFGDSPALFGHVAESGGQVVGMAVWFLNFSTWRGTHGVYLEDLYVRPQHRRDVVRPDPAHAQDSTSFTRAGTSRPSGDSTGMTSGERR